jgi:hypothetical protein
MQEELVQHLSVASIPGGLKYVLATRAGEGPEELLGAETHLLDSTGEPLLR